MGCGVVTVAIVRRICQHFHDCECILEVAEVVGTKLLEAFGIALTNGLWKDMVEDGGQ